MVKKMGGKKSRVVVVTLKCLERHETGRPGID